MGFIIKEIFASLQIYEWRKWKGFLWNRIEGIEANQIKDLGLELF